MALGESSTILLRAIHQKQRKSAGDDSMEFLVRCPEKYPVIVYHSLCERVTISAKQSMFCCFKPMKKKQTCFWRSSASFLVTACDSWHPFFPVRRPGNFAACLQLHHFGRALQVVLAFDQESLGWSFPTKRAIP